MSSITEYQENLRRELTVIAREEINKHRDAFNRSVVVITPRFNLHNPACERNTMLMMMRYCTKQMLAICARVCKAWKEMAYNPDIWSNILRKDNDADIQFRLFAYNPKLNNCSKLYYDRMSVTSKIDEVEAKLSKNDGILERTVDVARFTGVLLGVGLGILNMPSDDSYVVIPEF